jgi:hypothetical protein
MSKLYLFFVVAAVVQMCLAQAITQTKCAEKGGKYFLYITAVTRLS